jgi:hypothetical protein
MNYVLNNEKKKKDVISTELEVLTLLLLFQYSHLCLTISSSTKTPWNLESDYSTPKQNMERNTICKYNSISCKLEVNRSKIYSQIKQPEL